MIKALLINMKLSPSETSVCNEGRSNEKDQRIYEHDRVKDVWCSKLPCKAPRPKYISLSFGKSILYSCEQLFY